MWIHFLQTYVTVMLGLGAAVFVLLAVLPMILPQLWEDTQREVDTGLDEAKATRSLVKKQAIIANAAQKINDVHNVTRSGAASAFCLIFAAVLGLLALLLPTGTSGGLGYVVETEMWDFGLAILPILGFAFLASFVWSFLGALEKRLGHDKTKENLESEKEFKVIARESEKR